MTCMYIFVYITTGWFNTEKNISPGEQVQASYIFVNWRKNVLTETILVELKKTNNLQISVRYTQTETAPWNSLMVHGSYHPFGFPSI